MKIIDLFAGCGGLSLGFELAGFEIPLAIEKDEWASETYKYNHPNTTVITGDITKITELENIISKKDLPIDGKLDYRLIKSLRQYAPYLTNQIEAAVIEGALPNEVLDWFKM